MIRPLLTLALVAMPVAMAGCDAKLISAVGSALKDTDSNAPKARVTGVVYAPATQVAVISPGGANVISPGGANVISPGGANFRIAARSDEKGVDMARVSFKKLSGLTASGTAQTTTSGNYTVDLPQNADYVASASFKLKDGTMVTLTGLVHVGTGATSLNIDTAQNLLASKLVSLGVAELDSANLTKAYNMMVDDLSKVSTLPSPTSQSEAASEFDEVAGAELKTLVESMK